MPKVIALADQQNLVPTEKFDGVKFPFEFFNPVQSRVFEIYKEDANIIVASATASGKTTCIEMLFNHEIKAGGKTIYVSPLKALSQEKIDDWSDESHSFFNTKKSICTGDYRITKDRQEEINESQIIVTTYETLDSKSRNYKSDNVDFITKANILASDELHLLADESRGSKVEVALMKIAEINKKCRHLMLSATMPNVDEVGAWLSKLTDRDTYLIKSDYRPCELVIHYEEYNDDLWKYDFKQKEIVSKAFGKIKAHPEDKFIAFVHTKKAGQLLKQALSEAKINSDFHNADLDKEGRLKLENRFKNDPNFRVIIATSTLSSGINLPSRRVVILGVHCGIKEVSALNIIQECGRAGRPKYDIKGDAHILLPRKKNKIKDEFDYHKMRLQTLPPITSQLVKPDSNDHRGLAFHVINEISQGDITTVEGIYKWYSRTFAAFQQKDLDGRIVDGMVEKLILRGCIKDTDGKLEVTPVGRIAGLFYFSPYDVADLKQNFTALFNNEKEMDEFWISVALAKTDSWGALFASNAELDEMEQFIGKFNNEVRQKFSFGKDVPPQIMKMAFCYYQLLNGWSNPVFEATLRGLRQDVERTVEVLFALNGMAAKWNQNDYLRKLSRKLTYGVDWDLLVLCDIDGIGKVKSQKLWQMGIKSPADVVARPALVKSALGCSDAVLAKVMNNAKELT